MTKQESLKRQGCHTLLPTPSFLAQFLQAGIPWEVLAPLPWVCKKVFKHGPQGVPGFHSLWGLKKKRSLDSHFTDTKRSKVRANIEVD